MKIDSAQLFQYHLRLKQPIGPKGDSQATRQGLLIKLSGESGHVAWGEAAPLPGFSRETLSHVRAQLCSTLPKLEGEEVPTGVELLKGAFENWLGRFDLHPSARLAVEMAALNLVAVEHRKPMARLLSPDCMEDVPVNGLITTTGEDAVTRAQALCDLGYHTLKLKVGRNDLTEDIDAVRCVSRELPERVSLRLDANRAWSINNALEFARGIRGCEIEYIEEPLVDPARLNDFCNETDLPVALDETTREIVPETLADWSKMAAVVLKPTLLGGFENTAAFARAGSKIKAKVVMSSTFESPVGIAALANLAAAYGTRNTAAGLETATWFDQQLLVSPLALGGGKLNLSKAAEAVSTLDTSLLTRIDFDDCGGEQL